MATLKLVDRSDKTRLTLDISQDVAETITFELINGGFADAAAFSVSLADFSCSFGEGELVCLRDCVDELVFDAIAGHMSSDRAEITLEVALVCQLA